MECSKCRGFMVEEWVPDFSPEEEFAWRCVNCGLIVDPTISRNQGLVAVGSGDTYSASQAAAA
jgi:hypothetical protein